jgi:type II secretory pathway pseudopilin PulG
VRANKNRTGFTLVEIICATIVFCGAVLSLGAIATRSLGSTKLNRQYELAASLADRQLTYIDYIGIEEFIEAGQTEGQFSDFEPTYYWKAATAYEGTDNLYQVVVTVSWLDRRRVHSVSLDTMLNGTGLLIISATEE